MSCEFDSRGQLQVAGLRATPQRILIVAALRHARGHRTAEDIHRRVLSDLPHSPIALSTVYRTLETLTSLRLVAAVTGDGQVAFEWIAAEPAHHHFTCDRCESKIELPPAVVEGLADDLEVATGGRPFFDHLVVQGLCAACRSRSPIDVAHR